MSAILYLSAIAFGLMLRKNRAVTIYILLVMFILAAYNYMNADYESYLISYSTIANGTGFRYIGYSKLLYFFASRGFSFTQYRYVFFVMCFILLFISVRMLTNDVNFVLALYMIFSFPLDTVQMKTFISELFVLLGISLYIARKGNIESKTIEQKKQLICLLFLCLATLLHFSNFYYFIAFGIFIMTKGKENIQRKLLAISGIMALLVFSGAMAIILQFAGRIGLVGGLDYLQQWAQRGTHFGFIISVVLLAIILGAAGIDYSKYSSIDPSEPYSSNQIRAFISTAVLLAPFLVLNVAFVRMLRVYMILLCILYANKRKSGMIRVKELSQWGLFVLSIVYMFVYDVFTMYDYTLGAILRYNSFF